MWRSLNAPLIESLYLEMGPYISGPLADAYPKPMENLKFVVTLSLCFVFLRFPHILFLTVFRGEQQCDKRVRLLRQKKGKYSS